MIASWLQYHAIFPRQRISVGFDSFCSVM